MLIWLQYISFSSMCYYWAGLIFLSYSAFSKVLLDVLGYPFSDEH